MPTLNFDDTDGPKNPAYAGPGRHLSRLESVSEGTTRAGDPMWDVAWLVLRGPDEGKKIRDRIPFSKAARERVRTFLRAIGLNASGEVNVQPHDVIGKVAWVITEMRHERDVSGKPTERTCVKFDGYQRATAQEIAAAEKEHDGDL